MRINSSLLVPLLVLVGVLTINLNCGRGVFVSAFSSPRRTLSPQQIEVLLEIAESWPNLKTLSTGAWTRANLEQSCLGSPAALGISCDGYGWVIELAFTSESITTGPLPAALANLTRLMVFATAGGVSGSLPASFSALTHLTTFELSKSNIEGPIPASWSSLSNMTNLRLQWAPSAAVVGWTDGVLEGWLNLNKVVLSNLNVGPSNPLPPELFSSDSIATLQLLNVTFDGSMPIISNSNSALHTLVISGSPAVVSISASPSTVITADWSDLSITEMTLTNLPWSGDFPTFLPPNITMISLTNLPNLAGTIPSDLFDYGVLRVVTMVDLPEVAGSMPAPSNASTSILTSITMSNMAVTGSIEGSFFASRYLQDLKMENMEDMTPSALPEAGIECGLSALVLNNVKLTGTIPSSLVSNCTRLSIISLAKNGLSGSIPAQFADVMISGLILDDNALSGSLPPNLGTEFTLQNTFSVTNNQLNGTIPPSMYRVFTSFNISRNNFDICATASDMASVLNGVSDCNLFPQAESMCACAYELWSISCAFEAKCVPGWQPTSPPAEAPIEPPSTPETLIPGIPSTESPSASPSVEPMNDSSSIYPLSTAIMTIIGGALFMTILGF